MSTFNNDAQSTWKKLVPRSLWRQSSTIQLMALSVLSSLLLALMFLVGLLIVDLFVSRGSILLQGSEIAAARERFGPMLDLVYPVEEEVLPDDIELQNRGILHSLWSFQDRIWAEPLSRLAAQVPMLLDNFSALIILLAVGSILGLLRGLILVRCRLLAARLGMTVSNQMRRSLHRQAMRLGPSDLLDMQVGTAHELFRNDTVTIQDGVTANVYRLIFHPVALAMLVVLGLIVSPRVFVQMLGPLLLCWWLVARERSRFDASRKLAESQAELRGNVLAESLTKTRLIRGYSMENYDNSNFGRLLEQLSTTSTTVRRRDILSRWLCWVMVVLVFLLLAILVGNKMLLPAEHPQSMHVAEVVILSLVFVAAYKPLARLRDLIGIRHETALAAERIYRYLNQIPEVGQAVGAKFLDPLSRFITFENVTYSLPGLTGKRLLDQFEVKVPAGGMTVIASANPLEARAMLYMLPRFLEPHEGRVLIDGEDIAWVTLESLRAETLYVGGRDLYFTGNVMENILCGDPNYTQSDAINAAKKVHAHNFVQRLPQGYETVLGEHGEQLSPGQAYRLGLARALLRNPAMLLLEEPDVQLSEEDKSMIDDAYDQICPGRTTIVIPSRMSTIRRCDRIVLLYQGKVATMNTHQNLLSGNELYRHWEYTRFNVFRHIES
ncbi:ABC transporter transmembrane domain-containing protein [Rubinisphaera margarita]|uniref:ABC transporter transmembrane domain-containing protein n=1 Tax=Rubinisphaera margarita TaxID=2909586 RepID=UPI001EE90191|nr:ABC transporter ATP-binding protein [Rubinisphaera margarita]MCG6157500.1 ABC transporter ATP-binding protein/permease [Rubinisphaera margarita]